MREAEANFVPATPPVKPVMHAVGAADDQDAPVNGNEAILMAALLGISRKNAKEALRAMKRERPER